MVLALALGITVVLSPDRAYAGQFFSTNRPLVMASTDYGNAVFMLGQDGTIWGSAQIGAGGDLWEPWRSITSRKYVGQPAALFVKKPRVDETGTLEVYGVGVDSRVYVNRRYRDSAGKWVFSEVAVGTCACFQDSPSAAWGWTTANGEVATYRTELFVRGLDNRIYVNRNLGVLNDGDQSNDDNWFGWHPLGGETWSGAPVAAIDPIGRAEVFARGGDGQIYRNRQTAIGAAGLTSWTGWGSTGEGSLHENFTVVRIANISINIVPANQWRLELFALGGDNGIYRNRQTNSTDDNWTGWTHTGGWTHGDSPAVAAAVNRDGRIEAFVRGGDNQIYRNREISVAGGWEGWTAIGGGILATAPAAVRTGNGRDTLEVVALGFDERIWRARQTAAGATSWTGWESVACTYMWKLGSVVIRAGESYTGCKGGHLKYRADGTLGYYDSGGVLRWTPGVNAIGGRLEFGTDGVLRLLSNSGEQVWQANPLPPDPGSQAPGPATSVVIVPNENLIIIDQGGLTVWETGIGTEGLTGLMVKQAINRTMTGTQSLNDLRMIASVPKAAVVLPNPIAWHFTGPGPFWEIPPFAIGGPCGDFLPLLPIESTGCTPCNWMVCTPHFEPDPEPEPEFQELDVAVEVDSVNAFGRVIETWRSEGTYLYNGRTVQWLSTFDHFIKGPAPFWTTVSNTENRYAAPARVGAHRVRTMKLCLGNIMGVEIGCLQESQYWSEMTAFASGWSTSRGG